MSKNFRPLVEASPVFYVAKAGEAFVSGQPVKVVAGLLEPATTADASALAGICAMNVESATAGQKISVYDDPHCEFLAAADEAVTDAHVGTKCDLVISSGETLVDVGTTTNGTFHVKAKYSTYNDSYGDANWGWASDRLLVVTIAKHNRS